MKLFLSLSILLTLALVTSACAGGPTTTGDGVTPAATATATSDGAATVATATPTSGDAGPPATATPTLSGTAPIATATPTSGETIPTPTPTPAPTPTPTPTPTPAPTPTPTPRLTPTATPTPTPTPPAVLTPTVTFTVDSTVDAVDATPGDGVCDDGAGACTLRAAIMEANAVAGTAAVTLPAGTYTISIDAAPIRPPRFVGDSALRERNEAKTGDLDIADDLIIEGAGADTTIVDGGALDRVFHILAGSRVDMSGLTVRNGARGDGGGILNAGTLTLTDSTVSGNTSEVPLKFSGDGGGISNSGTLTMTNSTVSGNSGGDGGGISNSGTLTMTDVTVSSNTTVTGDGGGIWSSAALTLTNVTVSDNTVPGFVILNRRSGDGGGIAHAGGTMSIVDSTITGNRALKNRGGGIWSASGALEWTMTNVIVSGNSAFDGGGIHSGSPVTLTNVIVSDNSAVRTGGGIRLFTEIPSSSPSTLTNVTVSGNTGVGIAIGGGTTTVTGGTFSGNSGRGISNDRGQLTLTNVTVSGNTASGAGDSSDSDGGGIRNCTSGTLRIFDSTISGNTASRNGGGIINCGTLSMTNVTVSDNSAASRGGGIYNSGTLTLTNSAGSGNTAGTGGGGIFNTGTLVGAASTISGGLSGAAAPSLIAASVAAGSRHTCAVTTAGGVKCWGNNDGGQLGDGTQLENRTTPVDVVGLASGVESVSAGGGRTCAVTTAGGLKCWGGNRQGEVGDGTTSDRTTPVDVNGLSSGVAAVSVGSSHTCALTTAGGLKCWGTNDFGQLGDRTKSNRTTPVDVAGLTSGVVAVSVGEFRTCAVTTAGGVKCWGLNIDGQLGDGTTTDRTRPFDVVGLTSGVVSISVGRRHTCVLTTAGGVKCWGNNGDGRLGDGTTTFRRTPVDVLGLTSGVVAVSTGNLHTCALTTAGGVTCWGSNTKGQLGDGTRAATTSLVDIVGLTSGVVAISAGSAYTCAVTTAGGIKCVGSNLHGELGIGVTSGAVTPPVDVAGFVVTPAS